MSQIETLKKCEIRFVVFRPAELLIKGNLEKSLGFFREIMASCIS